MKRLNTYFITGYSRLIVYSLFLILVSCTSQRQSSQTTVQSSSLDQLINDSALQQAYIGISVYDPVANRYLYNYNADKYFVPASNTKLPTCYAAMKYMGDSLPAARIDVMDDTVIIIYPCGDPTFLNKEFPYQPLLQRMKGYNTVQLDLTAWESRFWGSGWSWSDYSETYMAERSALPMYGNLVHYYLSGDTVKSIPFISPLFFVPHESVGYNQNTRTVGSKLFKIDRVFGSNTFSIRQSETAFSPTDIPFSTNPGVVRELLIDTLNLDNAYLSNSSLIKLDISGLEKIRSQPTDSLLKIMMHRSDNFFAEQSLLMVSNERLGVMSEVKIIDTLLKTDLSNLPQRPRWVDGSGLSRYNLFSPLDFVAILNKMKDEFGMERIKVILPAGGEGTLSNYYKSEIPYLYAKTGTLSGVVALSGFLYTKQNKLLIFSVLVNNHTGYATPIRRAVEKFLSTIRSTE